MPAFRYLGKRVAGEDADGYPIVLTEIEAYGFRFNGETYTEVPDDAVAWQGMALNPATRQMEPITTTVVQKLRGNREFEERVEGDRPAKGKAA